MKVNRKFLEQRLVRVAALKHWTIGYEVGGVHLEFLRNFGYRLTVVKNARGGETRLSDRMTARQMAAFLDGIVLGTIGLP